MQKTLPEGVKTPQIDENAVFWHDSDTLLDGCHPAMPPKSRRRLGHTHAANAISGERVRTGRLVCRPIAARKKAD